MATTNCEDVSARMVELLYGELPADARSGVDAHVAGCARCRSELEGLEKTRAVARRALDESPPPRARAEILRRAAEHLAAQQPAAAAAAAAIVPAGKAKKSAEPQQSSFWDWLRSRWTLPSLATVGAVALLVIGSRVLLEPDKVDYNGSPEFQREARQAAAPATRPPEPAPQAAPAPRESYGADKDVAANAAAADKAAPPSTIAEDARGGAEASSYRSRAKAAAKPKLEAKTPSASTSLAAGGKMKKSESDRGDVGRFAPPPPPKPVTGFKMDDDAPLAKSAPPADLDGVVSKPARAPGPAKAGGAASSAAGVGSAGAGIGGGGRAAERPVAKEHVASEAQARLAEPAAAPAPPPPVAAMPPPAAPAARHESEKKVDKKARRAAADEESAAGPEEGKPATKSKASAETAVERANRLFTEGRWAEAVAAYRELLRRDPNNAEAARWRQRVAIAEAALESRRTTEPASAAPAR